MTKIVNERKLNGLLLVGAVLATVCALALAGCGVSNEVLVIREGRALLNHPAPGDKDWEACRAIYMKDSAVYAEAPAPSTVK